MVLEGHLVTVALSCRDMFVGIAFVHHRKGRCFFEIAWYKYLITWDIFNSNFTLILLSISSNWQIEQSVGLYRKWLRWTCAPELAKFASPVARLFHDFNIFKLPVFWSPQLNTEYMIQMIFTVQSILFSVMPTRSSCSSHILLNPISIFVILPLEPAYSAEQWSSSSKSV